MLPAFPVLAVPWHTVHDIYIFQSVTLSTGIGTHVTKLGMAVLPSSGMILLPTVPYHSSIVDSYQDYGRVRRQDSDGDININYPLTFLANGIKVVSAIITILAVGDIDR